MVSCLAWRGLEHWSGIQRPPLADRTLGTSLKSISSDLDWVSGDCIKFLLRSHPVSDRAVNIGYDSFLIFLILSLSSGSAPRARRLQMGSTVWLIVALFISYDIIRMTGCSWKTRERVLLISCQSLNKAGLPKFSWDCPQDTFGFSSHFVILCFDIPLLRDRFHGCLLHVWRFALGALIILPAYCPWRLLEEFLHPFCTCTSASLCFRWVSVG